MAAGTEGYIITSHRNRLNTDYGLAEQSLASLKDDAFNTILPEDDNNIHNKCATATRKVSSVNEE